ncbi:Hypothetical protein PHPALM_7092 [Phytophthora palmivora]|uniref:Uncharacterized protein n=1 Tax=Phytophthora palmivora TaxID=4796 RepID=A0A2P4YD81_9STRA|nr:Hypothetical protein PHPALM_7092 [Phytophthora palmivora]
MPSLVTIVSSFCLALLAFSTSETTAAGKLQNNDPTDVESKLLYSALGDLSLYSPDIDTFVCAKVVQSVKKRVNSRGVTKYKFVVHGCDVRDEFVGHCLDFFYIACGNYNVFITSDSKTDTLKVTSIKLHPVN